MTADRREYSRKPAFPDMSVPPPTSGIPPFDLPPPPHGVIPPTFPPHIDSYGSEFYTSETDPYYQSYEPTQDSQWNDPVSTHYRSSHFRFMFLLTALTSPSPRFSYSVLQILIPTF